MRKSQHISSKERFLFLILVFFFAGSTIRPTSNYSYSHQEMTGGGGSEISADSQTSIEKIVPSMNTPGSSINTRWLDPSRDLNVRESLSETTAPITNNFQ